MEEVDRFRVAAMLTTDAHLQIGLGLPAFLDRNSHQASNTIGINVFSSSNF